ncbi:hypothetical protein D3C81_986570 [compost metagenome]
MHVFLRGDTGNGRLVHAHRFGDVMQDQRLHRLVPVVEEAALVLDDLRGDLHQGFVTALQALDEPAGFLQLVAHEGVVGAGVGAADEACVLWVDPQARDRFLVQLHQPAFAVLAHDDIRDDVFRFARLDLRARARVEALHQFDDLAQFVFLDLHAAHQLAVVAAAQQVDEVSDQALGLGHPGRAGWQLTQLQQQAFPQVAGAHAGGFELLDTVQDRFDLVELDVQLRVEAGADFLEGVLQVTLAIDAVDQGDGDQAIGIRHRCQVQLPQQMALQALAGRGAGGEVPLVVIVAWQAAGAGLVDVFPGGIDRKLVGDSLVPLAVFQVVGADGGFLETVVLSFGSRLVLGVVRHRVAVVEVFAVFLTFEHRVRLQRFLDFLLEVQGGELEQADGLLQLRSHRQLLAHF